MRLSVISFDRLPVAVQDDFSLQQVKRPVPGQEAEGEGQEGGQHAPLADRVDDKEFEDTSGRLKR